jgi:hypothetical protein
MAVKQAGTGLCGWCLGPPGAKRPHRFGIPMGNCPCGCHRRPRQIETAELIVAAMRRYDWEDDGDAA